MTTAHTKLAKMFTATGVNDDMLGINDDRSFKNVDE